jgi:hypothetical protein
MERPRDDRGHRQILRRFDTADLTITAVSSLLSLAFLFIPLVQERLLLGLGSIGGR